MWRTAFLSSRRSTTASPPFEAERDARAKEGGDTVAAPAAAS